MPRGYGFIAERLIWAYGLLFPFALVEDVGWLVVPINVLVCLSFTLISEAGRVLEDPFTLFWNGLPLQNLSLTIERNLGERLGDAELVEIPGVDGHGILM
jgi:putative membrane protein